MGNKSSNNAGGNAPAGSSSSGNGGNGNPQDPQQSSSYYKMIKDSYQALVHAIIRPPRSKYETSQLGPTKFLFCGKHFQRTDFELINPRGMTVKCTLWEPVPEDRQCETIPCVIYMHGNSSSRLEALSALSVVLSIGACLFAFDFAGSGQSDGEYVSLGAFEKDDLDKVVEYLRGSGKISTIALWGRSMGAATALLHGDRDPSIAGMVLDSAFADLVMLAEELVEKGRQQGLFAPNFVVKMAISFIRSSVQKAANFDIKHLSPIANADKCFIPAVFVCGINDNFVSPNHSRKIYEKYGGDKNLVEVEGDHNTPRPKYLYDSIAIFLQNVLQIPDSWLLPDGVHFVRKLPWTYSKTEYNRRNKLLTADEQLALQLLEEDGVDIDSYAEMAMMQNVEDSLYGLLSGGGGAPVGGGSDSPPDSPLPPPRPPRDQQQYNAGTTAMPPQGLVVETSRTPSHLVPPPIDVSTTGSGGPGSGTHKAQTIPAASASAQPPASYKPSPRHRDAHHGQSQSQGNLAHQMLARNNTTGHAGHAYSNSTGGNPGLTVTIGSGNNSNGNSNPGSKPSTPRGTPRSHSTGHNHVHSSPTKEHNRRPSATAGAMSMEIPYNQPPHGQYYGNEMYEGSGSYPGQQHMQQHMPVPSPLAVEVEAYSVAAASAASAHTYGTASPPPPQQESIYHNTMPPHVERLGLHQGHTRSNSGTGSPSSSRQYQGHSRSQNVHPASIPSSPPQYPNSPIMNYSSNYARSTSSEMNAPGSVADLEVIKSHLEAMSRSKGNVRPRNAGQNGSRSWTCGTCTLQNPIENEVCEACGILVELS